MKKTIIIVLVALSCSVIRAQSLTYFTIASDTTGIVLLSQNVSIKISIMNGSKISPVIYSEAFNVTTDTTGLAKFMFGTGMLLSGSISNIIWGNNSYARIDVDPLAGSNFHKMGTAILDTNTHFLAPNQ